MIGTVAFINILALVAFALPQAKVLQDGTPQLLDDSDITPDGSILGSCPEEPKDLYDKNDLVGLSKDNKRFCVCKRSRNIMYVCSLVNQWSDESWKNFLLANHQYGLPGDPNGDLLVKHLLDITST